MAKNKNAMSKNFENLKAQMLKKKELAETVNKDTNNEVMDSQTFKSDINNDLITNESSTTNINTNRNDTNDVNTNVNKDVNITVDEPVASDEYIKEVEPIQPVATKAIVDNDVDSEPIQAMHPNTEYVARKSGTVSDININKIVIKKIEKIEQPKRITYYLRPETIKKIDKFSKLSGMGKSEFVQKILDEVLNNLEIER